MDIFSVPMSSSAGDFSGKRKRESDSDGKTELDLEKKFGSRIAEEISGSAKTVIHDKTDTSLASPSPKRSRVLTSDGVDAADPKSARKIEAAKASSVPASVDPSSTLHTPPCTPDFKTASSAAAGSKKPRSKELEHHIESPDSGAHVSRDLPSGGKVEPRKAFCTRCSKWVSLKKTGVYNLTRWNMHVEGCGQSPIKLDAARAKSEEAESSEDEGEGSKVLKFREPVTYDTYIPLTPVSSKSSESTPASEAHTSGFIASTESSPLINKGKKRSRDEGHDDDSIGTLSTRSSLDSKGSKRVKERHGDSSKDHDAHKRHVPGVRDLLKLPGKAVKRVFK